MFGPRLDPDKVPKIELLSSVEPDSVETADGDDGSVPVGLPGAPRSGGDAVPAPVGAGSPGHAGDSESTAAQGAESSGVDTVQDDSYGDVSRETSDIPHPRLGDVSRETAAGDVDEDLPLAQEAKRAVQVLNPGGGAQLPRPTRRRIMAVANQKGGVGKTTTTVNIAVSLALHGNRVLVIDLDPQGNASTGLGVDHHAGVPSIYESLIDNVPLDEVVARVEGIPNLVCAPATIDLAGAEIELVSVVARESRLKRAIEAYPEELDYVLIDCPPSLGLLTVNALVAAEEVMIPIQCEYYALEGLGQLIRNIDLVQAHLNPKIEVSTILLTMYDRRTRLADQVEQEVRSYFTDKVLQAVIPRNVRVSEAPSYGQSVMTYDPGSRGATSYFEAAQEIAQRGAKLGGSA
ncbi:ParA family protein [Longispora fulva]|uniref:ParA family protein n=1 Tax=Longispora fulva TaxID=619741 RepID=UPI00363C623D